MKPPIATITPTALEKHGHVRADNYFWLKDRDNPDVVAYLNEENAYAKASMAHTEELQENLFEEIKGRIKQTDMSVPYKLDDYYYYSRYDEGKEYPAYCRKRDSLEGEERTMLDLNEMAEGHDYIAVWGRQVSSDQTILAYAVDYIGRRINTIRFKSLETGATLADEIPDVGCELLYFVIIFQGKDRSQDQVGRPLPDLLAGLFESGVVFHSIHGDQVMTSNLWVPGVGPHCILECGDCFWVIFGLHVYAACKVIAERFGSQASDGPVSAAKCFGVIIEFQVAQSQEVPCYSIGGISVERFSQMFGCVGVECSFEIKYCQVP